MKIALFGGTFDPVHNGHMMAAEAALKKTRASELWFVPAYKNPWKKRRPFPAKHRLAMLRLAAKANPKFKAKDFEIQNKTGYTSDLVDFLLGKFPNNEFVLVVSLKTRRQVHKWKNAGALLKKVSVCTVPDFGKGLNSTKIRAMAKKCSSLSGFVPEAVEDYIRKNGLYGAGPAARSFAELVWAACKKIPLGRVSTYAEIAKAIRRPHAFRAVGNALNKSPGMPLVPCHRVVKSDGGLGGFARGANEKRRLLECEGVAVKSGRVSDLGKLLFKDF